MPAVSSQHLDTYSSTGSPPPHFHLPYVCSTHQHNDVIYMCVWVYVYACGTVSDVYVYEFAHACVCLCVCVCVYAIASHEFHW